MIMSPEHPVIDAISPQWERRHFTASLFYNTVPLQILPQNCFAFSSFLLIYFSENLAPIFCLSQGLRSCPRSHIVWRAWESSGLELLVRKIQLLEIVFVCVGRMVFVRVGRAGGRRPSLHTSLNRTSRVMSHGQSRGQKTGTLVTHFLREALTSHLRHPASS